MNILHLVWDVFFPSCCCCCGKTVMYTDYFICDACVSAFPETHAGCAVCGTEQENGECSYCRERHFYPERHFCFFLYEGTLRQSMRALKFDKTAFVARRFASVLRQKMGDVLNEVDMISFVPSSRKKYLERGFNQSYLIASALGAGSGVAVRPLLHETSSGGRQKDMSYDRRFLNTMGRFSIKKGAQVAGLRLLLVDDVFTTGSTLNECARILLQGGAKSVFSLSVARAGLKKLDK